MPGGMHARCRADVGCTLLMDPPIGLCLHHRPPTPVELLELLTARGRSADTFKNCMLKEMHCYVLS